MPTTSTEFAPVEAVAPVSETYLRAVAKPYLRTKSVGYLAQLMATMPSVLNFALVSLDAQTELAIGHCNDENIWSLAAPPRCPGCLFQFHQQCYGLHFLSPSRQIRQPLPARLAH